MIMILNMNASQKKKHYQHGRSKDGSKHGVAGVSSSPISAKAVVVSGSTTAVQVRTQDVAVARKVTASEKIKEMQTELKLARGQKMVDFMSEDCIDEPMNDVRPQIVQSGVVPQDSSARQGFLRDSVIGSVRIGSSVSSKLNYILNEVRFHRLPSDYMLSHLNDTLL